MKTTKTLFVALALTALPTMSFAMCSGLKHQEASMTCASGTVWDSESRSCVTVTG